MHVLETPLQTTLSSYVAMTCNWEVITLMKRRGEFMRLTVYSETFPRLMFQRGNHTAKRAAISIAFNAYGESRNTKYQIQLGK